MRPPSEAKKAALSGSSAAPGSPTGLTSAKPRPTTSSKQARHAAVSDQVLHEELARRGRVRREAARPERRERRVDGRLLLARLGRSCADRAPRPPRGPPRRSRGRARRRARSWPRRAARAPSCSCRGAPRPRGPRSTRSSFQARFAASRSPEHMPWPAKGGIWCAASPARSARPVAPAVGPARAEGVDGVALELRVGPGEAPGREQPPRGLLVVQLLERLVRQAHELEAPPARAARDERGRARRIAELPVERALPARIARAAGPPRASRSGSRGRASPSRCARARSCSRRRSRRRSARASVARAAVAAARLDRHAVRLELERDGLGAALDRHRRQRARALVEDPLELRLAEHVRLGPAREAPLRVAAEAEQGVAGGVPPLVGRRRHRAPGERVRDARALEDAPDLVVEVARRAAADTPRASARSPRPGGRAGRAGSRGAVRPARSRRSRRLRSSDSSAPPPRSVSSIRRAPRRAPPAAGRRARARCRRRGARESLLARRAARRRSRPRSGRASARASRPPRGSACELLEDVAVAAARRSGSSRRRSGAHGAGRPGTRRPRGSADAASAPASATRRSDRSRRARRGTRPASAVQIAFIASMRSRSSFQRVS